MHPLHHATPLTVTATTTDTGTGTGALILLALAALATCLVYAVGCVLWPFRACPKCNGTGRFRSPSGRTWRYCRTCHGHGAKLRTTRRIYNHLTRNRTH